MTTAKATAKSTASTASTATASPPDDMSGATEPGARFRDLVAAEWIKLRSLRSTWIAYGTTALAVIAFNVGETYDTYIHWSERNASGRADFVRDGIPLQSAFSANAALIMMLALGAIGAVTILSEYTTGANRTTFAAVPARHSVLAAKAVVVTAVTTVLGAFVAGASFFLTQSILDGSDVGASIGDPDALRIVLASALLAPVCALAGLALGAVIRQTAATMIACVVAIMLLPIILTDGSHWSAVVGHAMPYRAWLRLVDVDHTPDPFPWTTGGAWTVYALWTLAAAAVAVTCVRRRDQ